MSNAARKLDDQPGYLTIGKVVASRANVIVVELDGRAVDCERAAMCLLEPRRDDEVLVSEASGRRFVLGVLTRAATSDAARIGVDGDLELYVRRGRLSVTTQKGVDVQSAGEATLTAPRVALRAVEGEAMFDKVKLLAAGARVELGRLSFVAEKVDTLCERLWQRVKRSYRFVEETDQLRAGSIDQHARGLLRVHSDNAVITAKHLTKIDAGQIQLG
jgi:hypothetical protein